MLQFLCPSSLLCCNFYLHNKYIVIPAADLSGIFKQFSLKFLLQCGFFSKFWWIKIFNKLKVTYRTSVESESLYLLTTSIYMDCFQ